MHFHTGGLPDQRSYGRSGAELGLEGAVRGYLEGLGGGWFSKSCQWAIKSEEETLFLSSKYVAQNLFFFKET